MRSNGVQEWTILAGVVVEREGVWECAALATGLKAMPEKIISNCSGLILHDMHAEILSLRGFNRWLLCQIEAAQTGDSWWVEPSPNTERYKARDGLRVFLYISAPPCGDASMSLFTGESWESEPSGPLIRGRNHYGSLGYIRTKPGRQDSEMTMSKSCTDKLALRQQTGIVSGPLLRLLEPVFLTMLVCPVLPDFERAFRRWPAANYFDWKQPSAVFCDGQSEQKTPSPTSLVWVNNSVHEAIVNGVRQGSKPGSGKGTSLLSRHEIAGFVARLERADAEADYIEWKAHTKVYPSGWQKTAVDDFAISL